MFRVLGFVGLLSVLGIGTFIYSRQIQATSSPEAQQAAANPRVTVDVMGVKNDLVNIANAERRRFAMEGKYVPLNDLIASGDISMDTPKRGDFSYSSYVSEEGFRISATYSGSDPAAPKSLSIDQTMELGQ